MVLVLFGACGFESSKNHEKDQDAQIFLVET